MHSVILVLTTPTVTNVCDGPCTMTVQINCSENRIKYLSTYSQLSNDIMQARQCDHFTLMLHQLCWLPVQRRWSTRSHAWCNIHCLARHLCISSIYRPRLWLLLPFAQCVLFSACTAASMTGTSRSWSASAHVERSASSLRWDICCKQLKQLLKTFLFGSWLTVACCRNQGDEDNAVNAVSTICRMY